MQTNTSCHACCLCNTTEFDTITTNLSFGVNILKCSKCNLIQSEYISNYALRDYYGEYYRGDLTEAEFPDLRKLSHRSAVSQMDYLTSILPDERFENVLEIGCGIGELAKELAIKHGNVSVTEVDPRYAAYLKKEKSIVYIEQGELENEKYSQYFDFVVLCHVLEHLPDPVAWLDDISRIVKKDGYLFIELPNESDLLINHNFQGKGHLVFYTIGTLNSLISSQGSFDIVEIRSCNRSVEDYVASGFSLPDDFSLKYSVNGTTIRALLVNKRPKGLSKDMAEFRVNHRSLADEYSRRILHLHQQNMNLRTQMTALQKTCRTAIAEAKQIVSQHHSCLNQ